MKALCAPTDSFDVQLPLVAGAVPFDAPPTTPAPVLVVDEYHDEFTDTVYQALPASMHQRLFGWPLGGVGPLGVAGYPQEKANPPQELTSPAWQLPLPIWTEAPKPFAPIPDDQVPELVGTVSISTPRVDLVSQSAKSQWTLRPDDPIAYSVRPSTVVCDCSSRQRISGVTRDSAGTAIGSCTVCVITAEGLAPNEDVRANPVVAVVTSAANGAFSVDVRGNTKYQLMAYRAGSPDIMGVTVNTVQAVQDV